MATEQLVGGALVTLGTGVTVGGLNLMKFLQIRHGLNPKKCDGRGCWRFWKVNEWSDRDMYVLL